MDATCFVALIASAFEQLTDPGLLDKLQDRSHVLFHNSNTCTEGFKVASMI
ncbi:MAG: hypothetical protein MUE45_01260 [Methanoregulaceae archaeon]|nr:hypothetical protein [Methanoregulaceae archaeon]